MRTDPPTLAEALAALRDAIADASGTPPPPAAPWPADLPRRARAAVVARLEDDFSADLRGALRERERSAAGEPLTLLDVARLVVDRFGTLPQLPPRSCWRCGYEVDPAEARNCPECGWSWGPAPHP